MSNVLAAIVATSIAAGSPAPAPAPAEGAPTEASPEPAPAPAVGKDVVHLKSGGFVRGTVEEYEPGGPVVLRKSDGSVRTFEGSEVDRVEIGGAEKPAQPEPATDFPTTAPQPVPERAADGEPSSTETRVHLVRVDNGSMDIALQRRTGGVFVSGYGGSASGVSWETTCTAPCGRRVDTNGAYFVNGLNKGPVLASKTVNLNAYAGRDVTLEVKGGKAGVWAGGFVLVTAGATAAALSPLWFIIDDYSNATGAVLLATGTGALIAGIVMMVRGRHRVTAVPGRPSR